jgi:ABC-type transport system involved in multi-copper enzyme maturation permease subunit
MNWLLWKDYRHNRVVVVAGLLLLLGPYAMVLFAILAGFDEPRDGWASAFVGAAAYSLFMSQLTVAVVGGNAIAGERVDRSAEFLASLPITREKIVASKLLFALAVVAAIWLVNTGVFWSLRATIPGDPDFREEKLAKIAANIALTGLVFFCVGWCLSSFLTSPTFSVAGALVTPLLFVWTYMLVAYLIGERSPLGPRMSPAASLFDNFELSYRIFCLTLAPLCFAIGTRHYLRRVEP